MCNTPLVLYIQWLMTRDPRPQKGTVAKATAPLLFHSAVLAAFATASGRVTSLPCW